VLNGWMQKIDINSEANKLLLTSNVFAKVKESTKAPRLIFDGKSLNGYIESWYIALPDILEPLKTRFNYCAKLDLSNAYMHFPVSE
jgi:hypothetical protein